MLNTLECMKSFGPARLLLGESDAMRAVRTLVQMLCIQQASVIVTGPSGSGKECVARALHDGGPRRDHPFVAVNCGAIPRDLIEAELFGHERGAFTGAHNARAGRFEQANGGTLFLDEIGDMPLDMQVRLLRVIEERRVQRVGGTVSIPVDVRIVSATHRDIGLAIAEGRFREDLYYRLAVVPIDLPPLTARREDIRLLFNHFASQFGIATFNLDDTAETALLTHSWPGNVRELRNLVERLGILHDKPVVRAADIVRLLDPPKARTVETGHPTPRPSDRPFDLAEELARIEAAYISAALARSGGVVAATARHLGLRRTTLVEKMRRYDLGRPVVSLAYAA